MAEIGDALMIGWHTTTTALLLTTIAWTVSAQAAVLTPYEVFADCKAAKQFRDVELPKKLDIEFDRYRRGVQTRVNEVIKDFEESLKKSKDDLQNGSDTQKKEMSIAASRFFASLLLKKYAANMKGPWKNSYDALNDHQKRAVDVIIAKTNGLGDLTLDAARGKQAEISDAVKPYADAAVEALSWGLGPISKVLVEAVKGGSDVGLAYLTVKPDVDFSAQQVEFWRKQLDQMIKSSPDARVQTINAAKLAIDGACGG